MNGICQSNNLNLKNEIYFKFKLNILKRGDLILNFFILRFFKE
jgi:hypothetical protein